MFANEGYRFVLVEKIGYRNVKDVDWKKELNAIHENWPEVYEKAREIDEIRMNIQNRSPDNTRLTVTRAQEPAP